MDFATTFNSLEAVFWLVFGVVLLCRRPVISGQRPLQLVAGVFLVLFGISDVVEVWSGAWWRPWWLLVWKGTCVVTLLVCLVRFLRARRCANMDRRLERDGP